MVSIQWFQAQTVGNCKKGLLVGSEIVSGFLPLIHRAPGVAVLVPMNYAALLGDAPHEDCCAYIQGRSLQIFTERLTKSSGSADVALEQAVSSATDVVNALKTEEREA
jgi:hypothetical protein